MKAFSVVVPGMEGVAALELGELGAANAGGSGGVVAFEAGGLMELCGIAYSSQSASRVCLLICEFASSPELAATVADFSKRLLDFKSNNWTDEQKFSLECERLGSHQFTSHDFMAEASELISKASGSRLEFRNSKLRLYCFINESRGYFGIDLAGFDLGKRDYRIFGHSSDLKATAAYSLVRLSGYGSKKSLLDPFSRSGSISIEAALFASGVSPHYYRKESFAFLRLKPFSQIPAEKIFAAADRRNKRGKLSILNISASMAHLSCAEKNAKIAGVNKLISFSRAELQYLDLKLEKGSVGCIVSYPPMVSQKNTQGSMKKLYREFFYQAAFLLSKNGIVVVAGRDEAEFGEAASAHNFVLSSRLDFAMGSDSRKALTFVRKQP